MMECFLEDIERGKLIYNYKLEVDGEKGVALHEREVLSQTIKLGVRPEHMILSSSQDKDAFECMVLVNEMMGSELHLHLTTKDNTKLILRVPTLSLSNEQRKSLSYGSTIYVSFEGRAMHFFDLNNDKNLLVD